MVITGEYYNDWILAAGVLIVFSLFIYGLWDMVCAAEQQFSH